jgi:hypothetical protein
MSLNRLTENQLLQIQQGALTVSGNSDEWPKLKDAIETLTGKPLERKSARWLKQFCQDCLRSDCWRTTYYSSQE